MRLAAAVAILLLAGCLRPAPSPDGGAEGVVWLGPTCPVERDPPEPGCEDRPFATDLEVVTQGRVQVRLRSGEDGAFRVALPPGDYELRGAQDAAQPPTCSSPPFAVTAGAYTRVDVACDSGIR